jgi:hypothetical protein
MAGSSVLNSADIGNVRIKPVHFLTKRGCGHICPRACAESHPAEKYGGVSCHKSNERNKQKASLSEGQQIRVQYHPKHKTDARLM